jgi:hypothetical protein
MTRSWSWRLSLLSGLLLVGWAPLWSYDHDQRASSANTGAVPALPLNTGAASQAPLQIGGESATRAAIERGLRFLSSSQAGESDGSIPSVGTKPARLAVTALGALAYMSAGNTIDRGPHGADLRRAIDYLLTHVDLESTSRTRGYISDAADKNSKLHAHGFATLALAEAYAVSPRTGRGARIAEALRLSLQLMEQSQGIEGGWFYDPIRGLEHEGSVTIALVQAMRSAKNAGLGVNSQVIVRAVDYVRRSQREDGAFRYAIGTDRVSVALTAAAISTLNATGKYHGSEIQQGFDSIQRELRRREDPGTGVDFLPERATVPFPYYERLYLAQAYWQNPDSAVFESWFVRERERLLRSQGEDGSWKDPRFGATYATAINTLVLAIPDQLLPILQR